MTKNKKIKHFSIDEKIENSKFSYTKNLKYFIIAPIIIIVVGIILLCTLGFNLGFDFTGGTNMTIFVNSSDWADENFSGQVYDIDDDYETICNKISNVLNKYGLTASSFQKNYH